MLVEGVREDVAAELAVEPAAERRTRGGAMRTAGATMTGVGIAGIGVGIGLAVLDEAPIRSRCTGDNKDIEGHCKYRYDSLAAGITMAVLGAAALATGIALLAVDHKRQSRAQGRARPGCTGARAALLIRGAR